MACAAGSYRVLPAQLRENAAVTPCGPCTTCQSGVNYETTACSATQNRVCSTCRASCGAGNYIKTACTVTSNTVCEACTSRCPTNKYLSGDTCGGNTNNDVVLARCLSCLTEADCQPTMTYLSHVCDGTTSVKNSCQGCTPKQCGFGFYSGGWGGLSDTRCLPHRVCPSGQYLRGSSSLTDGVCENCTSCTALGLVTVMECSRYADAVCGGDICGAGKPCGGPSRRFCDYASMPSAPSCGSCPVRPCVSPVSAWPIFLTVGGDAGRIQHGRLSLQGMPGRSDVQPGRGCGVPGAVCCRHPVCVQRGAGICAVRAGVRKPH